MSRLAKSNASSTPTLALGLLVFGGSVGDGVVGINLVVGLTVGLFVGLLLGGRVDPHSKLLSKSHTLRNSLNTVPEEQYEAGLTTFPPEQMK
mmetsp:Transcript_5003/g.10798  ORF Transcript_5003/g.10798 Transcript_5003/m.10798 type:complete len:92 (+) Transcript_5003:944-1219(+)